MDENVGERGCPSDPPLARNGPKKHGPAPPRSPSPPPRPYHPPVARRLEGMDQHSSWDLGAHVQSEVAPFFRYLLRE